MASELECESPELMALRRKILIEALDENKTQKLTSLGINHKIQKKSRDSRINGGKWPPEEFSRLAELQLKFSNGGNISKLIKDSGELPTRSFYSIQHKLKKMKSGD